LVIWNWKAALLSAVYRAPVFFATNLSAGWRLAMSAMFVEGIFRAFTSGFYGAFTQLLRNLQPAWIPVVILAVITPLLLQALEIAFHVFAGTPNLRQSAVISTVITAGAALFNLFAMRRGALLTGAEGQSLGKDLKSLPLVIFEFVSAPWSALTKRAKPKSGL